MNKAIFLLLLIFVSSFSNVSGSGGQVDIILGYPEEVQLNKEFDIKFEIFNNSNDRIWDAEITIEKDFINKYGEYINSNTNYSSNPFKYVVLGPGYKVNDTFKLTFKDDFPEDKVTFNIIFEGKKGSCRCSSTALYIKKQVTINVQKKIQATITLKKDSFEVYSGETLEIPLIIKNTGDIKINNVLVYLLDEKLSSEKLEKSLLKVGEEHSCTLIVPTNEEHENKSFNPSIILSFKDSTGKEIKIIKQTSIKVNNKIQNIEEKIIKNEGKEEKNITFVNINHILLLVPLVSLIVIMISYFSLIRKR